MDAKIQIIKEISKLFLNLNKEITYRKKVKSEEWRMERIRGYKNKKPPRSLSKVSAVRTRLELVTSCVTGRHSNQLN